MDPQVAYAHALHGTISTYAWPGDVPTITIPHRGTLDFAFCQYHANRFNSMGARYNLGVIEGPSGRCDRMVYSTN